MKNTYEVRGDFAVVFLKRRDGSIFEAKIDVADLETVKTFPNTWIAAYAKSTESFYAHGVYVIGDGKRTTISMQRFITDAKKGEVVDHVNHDTLDNRRSNLRVVDYQINALNRSRDFHKNKSSGVTGVTFSKQHNNWVARIGFKYERMYLGSFINKEDAIQAVEQARKKLIDDCLADRGE